MHISKTKPPPCPELRGSIDAMKYPALSDIKVDGEFEYIILLENDACCVNKYGTVKRDFTALMLCQQSLKSCKHSKACLLGELYMDNGKAGDFYVMQANKNRPEALNLFIHDIVMLDGVDLRNQNLLTRREMLHEALYWCPATNLVNNKQEALDHFKTMTSQGWEGTVIKSCDSKLVFGPCSWVKMKKKDQNDYEVHLIDPVQERIEVLVKTPGMGYQGAGVRVGVKCCHRYKRHIKVGDIVTIEHQGVLASGSLRHPVLIPKKEWKC